MPWTAPPTRSPSPRSANQCLACLYCYKIPHPNDIFFHGRIDAVRANRRTEPFPAWRDRGEDRRGLPSPQPVAPRFVGNWPVPAGGGLLPCAAFARVRGKVERECELRNTRRAGRRSASRTFGSWHALARPGAKPMDRWGPGGMARPLACRRPRPAVMERRPPIMARRNRRPARRRRCHRSPPSRPQLRRRPPCRRPALAPASPPAQAYPPPPTTDRPMSRLPTAVSGAQRRSPRFGAIRRRAICPACRRLTFRRQHASIRSFNPLRRSNPRQALQHHSSPRQVSAGACDRGFPLNATKR